MTDTPAPSKAEQLAALDMYLKALKPYAEKLRSEVTAEMTANHDERKGAYLPDGTKIASVTLQDGRRSASVTDEAAALAWCLKNYPSEVETVTITSIRPAFMKKLLDVAGSLPAGPGLDPATGQELSFITVRRGDPFVSVTTTTEGVTRMAALAEGFPKMLEGPKPYGPGQGPDYDPDFADRLANGAYQ